ncbi:MAG: fused MFS/spermidine synthase [Elusimicrobia bacterium]|nr:fused MFS/spermidine synthase [Elusimicrobiota bacterium]
MAKFVVAPGRTFILATVFITGAAVLALEIFGTRLIAPFYGSTIYVWSSLIAVTLFSLALGYLVGGIWADRQLSSYWFFGPIAAAGCWAAFIPLVRPLIFVKTQMLGVALGALASAAALFAAPLVLLGSVGPQAIRRISADMGHVGRSSGYVYALSTLGSVMGALLSGFWLISVAPMTQLTLGLAALLAGWSALGFWRSNQVRAAVSTAAIATVFSIIALKSPSLVSNNMLMNRESPYGQVKVLEHQRVRYLLIDGVSHSSMDMLTGQSVHDYVQFLEALPWMRKRPQRALVVGLGGADLPRMFERQYGMIVDAAEIDPVVLDAAQRFFGFERSRGEVRLWDGRRYVRSRPTQYYDFVIMDAFGADRQPPHLITTEFFHEAKRILKFDGILAINTIGLVRDDGALPWENLYRTLQESFSNFLVIGLNEDDNGIANIILMASDSPMLPQWETAPENQHVREFWSRSLNNEIYPDAARLLRARAYRDDFASFDIDSTPAMVKFRAKLIKSRAGVLLF